MIKRILVGLGDNPFAATATQLAIGLAESHGAHLRGMSFLDIDRLEQVGAVPLGASEAADRLRSHRVLAARRAADEAIAEFETACARAGVKWDVEKPAGDPFGQMIWAARYYDLVVCGLKGLFEHGVVDEPPDELVRLIVAGVRPILAVPEASRPVRRVLIAYSGSMESAKTFKRFVQMGLWRDAVLRIVTFSDDPQHADRLLADAGDYCRAHGLGPEVEHVEGAAKNQLLPYAADWNADLLVVGNSAKKLLWRRLFGETALNVIRNSNRPVFLSQ